MRTISSSSTELVNSLEKIEIAAWKDIFSNTPEDLKNEFGISFRLDKDIFVSAVPKADVLGLNRAFGLGLDKLNSGSTLKEIIDYFKGNNVQRFFVQLCPSIFNEKIENLLKDHGFQHYNNWIRLYRNTDLPPVIDSGLRTVHIKEKDSEILGSIITQCFDWPEGLKSWFKNMTGSSGWHQYLAYDRDIPVAAAAMFLKGKRGWFGMAATLPEYRKQGAQSALISRRIKDAVKAGCELLSVETAEDRPDRPAPSFHNLLRMGFHEAYKRMNFIYKF